MKLWWKYISIFAFNSFLKFFNVSESLLVANVLCNNFFLSRTSKLSVGEVFKMVYKYWNHATKLQVAQLSKVPEKLRNWHKTATGVSQLKQNRNWESNFGRNCNTPKTEPSQLKPQLVFKIF